MATHNGSTPSKHKNSQRRPIRTFWLTSGAAALLAAIIAGIFSQCSSKNSPGPAITASSPAQSIGPAGPQGATINQLSLYSQTSAGWVFFIQTAFNGFQGKNCIIAWYTVYNDTGQLADSSGSANTGTLLYDSDTVTDYVAVAEPSYGYQRAWHPVFFIKSPDGSVLATRPFFGDPTPGIGVGREAASAAPPR
ncbi:hypothetical protein ACH47Z_08695 [Streptomyces sp. NPDC020192]|uniref:hypothetical protein n=1 Tax=Streptomyces sp. NPDC020192 TaxID=3365066 RepID=UPI0037A20823